MGVALAPPPPPGPGAGLLRGPGLQRCPWVPTPGLCVSRERGWSCSPLSRRWGAVAGEGGAAERRAKPRLSLQWAVPVRRHARRRPACPWPVALGPPVGSMCLQVSFSPRLYPARFPAPWEGAAAQHVLPRGRRGAVRCRVLSASDSSNSESPWGRGGLDAIHGWHRAELGLGVAGWPPGSALWPSGAGGPGRGWGRYARRFQKALAGGGLGAERPGGGEVGSLFLQ